MKTQVVRVATTNNFNCTNSEFKQLTFFRKRFPNKYFFINANIHTSKLPTIAKTDLKVVVTANPNLTDTQDVIQKLLPIKKHIAFIRVKYLPGYPEIVSLIKELNKLFPVVITLQRFNGKTSLNKFSSTKHYKWNCQRYRLNPTALKKVYSLVKSQKNTYICDKSGKGCSSCGLCSTLTIKESLPITSLNLSQSGVCKFDCPDCYAKTMQHFATSMGNRPINYNCIAYNNKQAGRTKHIKENSL